MTGTIIPRRTKILLVEDDSGVRRSLQLLLQGRGYDVRAYAGGAQMLDDPRSLEAACLVTDYRMDPLDGFAILQTLRARGWMRPAVLITAFGACDSAIVARAAGFDMVLEKPLHDHLLVEAVGRMTRVV